MLRQGTRCCSHRAWLKCSGASPALRNLPAHHQRGRLVGDQVGLQVFDMPDLADGTLGELGPGDAHVAVLELAHVMTLRTIDHAANAVPTQHKVLAVMAGAVDPACVDIGFGYGHGIFLMTC